MYQPVQHLKLSIVSCSCLSLKDDAAVYLCVVLQRTIERLVAGALTSCGKPDLRTKYGGTGRDVQPGADVQPRHLQVT